MSYEQKLSDSDSDTTALTTVAEPVTALDKVSFHAAGINVAWNKLVGGITKTKASKLN
jgi:hypothetical protein